MSKINQTKYDYETNPSGIRKVSRHIGDYNCANCYMFSQLCNNRELCDENHKIKEYLMSYKEFLEVVDRDLFMIKFGAIPETYKEYCELDELYGDMPDLVEGSYYIDECSTYYPDNDFNKWCIGCFKKLDTDTKLDMNEDSTYNNI